MNEWPIHEEKKPTRSTETIESRRINVPSEASQKSRASFWRKVCERGRERERCIVSHVFFLHHQNLRRWVRHSQYIFDVATAQSQRCRRRLLPRSNVAAVTTVPSCYWWPAGCCCCGLFLRRFPRVMRSTEFDIHFLFPLPFWPKTFYKHTKSCSFLHFWLCKNNNVFKFSFCLSLSSISINWPLLIVHFWRPPFSDYPKLTDFMFYTDKQKCYDHLTID